MEDRWDSPGAYRVCGRVRYTAVYRDLKGRQRSAGTFATQRQADRAWQRAEAKVAQGYLGDPGRGRQTFRAYVENTWLPNHEIEASTRQTYTYLLDKHMLDEFGPMRMIDILPEHVREWITGLKARGSGAGDDPVLLHRAQRDLHHGPERPGDVPAPVQGREDAAGARAAAHDPHAGAVRGLYECLPDAQSKLLVETAVESGLRWGELTELRVRDLDFATRMLTVSRAVVQVNPDSTPITAGSW